MTHTSIKSCVSCPPFTWVYNGDPTNYPTIAYSSGTMLAKAAAAARAKAEGLVSKAEGLLNAVDEAVATAPSITDGLDRVAKAAAADGTAAPANEDEAQAKAKVERNVTEAGGWGGDDWGDDDSWEEPNSSGKAAAGPPPPALEWEQASQVVKKPMGEEAVAHAMATPPVAVVATPEAREAKKLEEAHAAIEARERELAQARVNEPGGT